MKERLDILVSRRLASSRERARAMIMEGKILVNGAPASKAGAMIDEDASISLRGEDIPYVGRGGLKLEAALDHFDIDAAGMTVMDVGSSTGGFTDCLLQRGAERIYCIDVGYGQLAWRLRNDPRVELFERTNIRTLERNRIPGEMDLAVVDVSFISLKLVIPRVAEFVSEKGAILALVKPQFEVGRKDVGKGGIVRNKEKRLEAVNSIMDFCKGMGLDAEGMLECPVAGQKGNVEYFLYMRRP